MFKFLSKNTDVSAWSPTDIPRIDLNIICHKLSTKPDAKPIMQRPKGMNEERSHAINDEVDHLLQAGFIQEMFYPNWLSYPILVKKRT